MRTSTAVTTVAMTDRLLFLYYRHYGIINAAVSAFLPPLCCTAAQHYLDSFHSVIWYRPQYFFL